MCWLVISEALFPLMEEMSQSFKVRALSIVSAVVKVLLTTITSVSSGFSLFKKCGRREGGGGCERSRGEEKQACVGTSAVAGAETPPK